MLRPTVIVSLAPLLALGACAVAPPGPSLIAYPGQGKSLEAFQQDDFGCRQYASTQTGYVTPGEAATQSGVGSAAIGTLLGAAAGALLGAAGGSAGAGAAIGAGSGLLLGSVVGTGNAAASGASLQQSYDVAYAQCMVARGDTVQQPVQYASAGYPVYSYPYPAPVYAAPVYAAPGYYGPSYGGTSVSIGIGTGWGYGGGWYGPRWRRWGY